MYAFSNKNPHKVLLSDMPNRGSDFSEQAHQSSIMVISHTPELQNHTP